MDVAVVAKRLREALNRALPWVLAVLLAVVLATALAQVVLRYGFGSALRWVEEFSVTLMIWSAWLGAIYLWLSRSHLRVDFFEARFGNEGVRLHARVVDFIGLAIGAWVAWGSLSTLTMYAGLTLPATELDARVQYGAVTVGATGIALAAILNLIADWRESPGK